MTDALLALTKIIACPVCALAVSLQIQFHNDKTEFVGEHVVRVPRDGNVGDVLAELSKRLGADYEGRQLRLLEVYQSKIYKVWAQHAVGSAGGGQCSQLKVTSVARCRACKLSVSECSVAAVLRWALQL